MQGQERKEKLLKGSLGDKDTLLKQAPKERPCIQAAAVARYSCTHAISKVSQFTIRIFC